jgi:intein/homing endonuclease
MQDLEEAKAKNADLFELQDHNLWMKSEDELNQFWESRYVDDVDYDLFKQAKANTVLICERAKGVELDRSIKLPKLPDENDVLKEEIFKGFRRRQLPMTKEYSDRLKEEYSLICDKEFSSYFLIEQMMTDEARRVAPEILGFGDGSEAVGPGRGCLSPMTPIRLASGETCSMRDVKIGKKVFTIDGTIQKVKNIFRYDLKDECLLKIKTFYGDYLGVELTKDHKVYVEKQVRPLRWDRWKNSTKKSRKSFDEPIGKLSWLRADEISVGDWCFVPIPKVEIYNTEFDLSVENTSLKNGKKLWADSSYVYHEFNSKIGRDKRVMLRNWKLDEQWAFVLGVFVGDGWTRKEDRGEVGFCDNTKSTDNHLEFIENIFKNIGCDSSWFYAKNKNVKQLIIKSHYMRKLFDKLHPFYEHTACTKHVPECVLHGSETIVLAYLNGYFLSDGHEGKNKASFTTVSRTLAEQIRFLLLRVGLPSSLLLDERTDSREEYSNRQNSYVITFPLSKHVGCSRDTKEKYVWRKIDGGLLLRIMEISETFDVKEVFDLEIENNHNFLTSSFLVHNSACGSLVCYCLGITDVNPIPHGLLFSRFLSPARGGKSMKVRFTQKPVGVEMVTVVEELDEKSGSEPVKVEFGEVDVQQVYQMAKERHAKRSGRQGNLDAHNLEDIAVGILAELACEWLGFGFMDKKIYDGLGDQVSYDLYDEHGVGVGHVKAKRPKEPGWLLSKQEPFKQKVGEPVFLCTASIYDKGGVVYLTGFIRSEQVAPNIKPPYKYELHLHKDGLYKKDLIPILKSVRDSELWGKYL